MGHQLGDHVSVVRGGDVVHAELGECGQGDDGAGAGEVLFADDGGARCQTLQSQHCRGDCQRYIRDYVMFVKYQNT